MLRYLKKLNKGENRNDSRVESVVDRGSRTDSQVDGSGDGANAESVTDFDTNKAVNVVEKSSDAVKSKSKGR